MKNVMTKKDIQADLFNHLLEYHSSEDLAVIDSLPLGVLIEIAHDYDRLGLDEEGNGPKTLVVDGYSVIENYKLIIPKII